MPVYRLTEFTSPDMSKTVEFCETLRDEVAAAGAESIDVISVGGGKGVDSLWSYLKFATG